MNGRKNMNNWNCPICGAGSYAQFPDNREGYGLINDNDTLPHCECHGCSVMFCDPSKFNAVEIFGEEVIEEVKNIFDKIVE